MDPSIIKVFRCPPKFGWLKCNTNRVSTASSSSYAGIFSDHLSDLVAVFAENLDSTLAPLAKISCVLRDIELASRFN